ncbi:MAG TPA: hypothetical protein VGF69_20710 [Thermoanaerobaculia bacterium]|jgi:hypothetical protein
MLIRFAIALALLLPTLAHADTLADVRTALGRLTARQPIRATYEVRLVRDSKGRFANTNFRGNVAVELESDADGVTVTVPRPVLDEIARERKARLTDPKAKAPVLGALDDVDPTLAAEVLDFAPALLHKLDGAKVLQEKPGVWQGKPVRMLVVQVQVERPSANGEVRLGKQTVTENRMTLWLGEDLVPLAAEHVLAVKASFLILRGEFKDKSSWVFGRHGDRLVRVRYDSNGSMSGMGQSGTESRNALLKVH